MRSAIGNRYLSFAALGVLQEAAYVAIVRIGDLKTHRVPFLVCIMAAALFYLIAAWLTLRPRAVGVEMPPPSSDAGRRELRMVMLAAVIFRLTLLPLQPSLSGELLRAHWDGKIQAVGFNPYQYPPRNGLFAPIRAASDGPLETPGIAATAPPLAELLARWDFEITSGLRSEKLLYLAFDLLTIALLVSELRRRGLPAQRVLLYAWAPLGVLEVAGNGHAEPMAIFFTLLALAWLGRHDRAAGMALIAGMATSFVAWAAAPAWFLRARHRAWIWMALLAVLLLLPYIFIAKHVALPLAGNLAAFLARWRGVNAGLVAKGALALVPARHPAMEVLPAALAAVATTAIWRRSDPWRAAAAGIAAALLLAPNMFPWYALWVLPGLALFPQAAWLWFSVGVLLGYGVIDAGASRLATTLVWVEYAPLYALLLWQWLRMFRRSSSGPSVAAEPS